MRKECLENLTLTGHSGSKRSREETANNLYHECSDTYKMF